jgi:hypothetical protein
MRTPAPARPSYYFIALAASVTQGYEGRYLLAFIACDVLEPNDHCRIGVSEEIHGRSNVCPSLT